MIVNIKNSDLVAMYNTLMKFKSSDTSKYFSYALIKNLSLIENDITILKDLSVPSNEYQIFLRDRADVCARFSDLDENGMPIISKNVYSIKKETQNEYHEEMKSLIDKNKNVLQNHLTQKNEYEKILNNQVTFDFISVDFEFLPKDISGNDLKSIECFVIYPEK